MVAKKTRRVVRHKSIEYRGTECLNCGHPLDKSDRYCSYCSQINSTKRLTASDYFSEFLSSILVYDSRLRYTLRDIFRPGKMTINYVKGQRLKYANPFRFFLSVSIIYFLLNNIVTEIVYDEADFQIEFAPKDTVSIKTPATFLLKEKGDTQKAEKIGIHQYFSEAQLKEFSVFDRFAKRSAVYLDYHFTYPEKQPQQALQELDHTVSGRNIWIYSRMVTIKKIIENSEDFFVYVRGKFPFFLFFFAPIFALIFLLLYPKDRFKYMDHLIFVFHIFSFFFLLNILLLLPTLILKTNELGSFIMLLVLPVYFLFALRRFYAESRWRTFFKAILLAVIFNFSLVIAILIFITGSIAMY